MDRVLKLHKIIIIQGKIKVLTGLRIGAGDTEMRIGGADNLVIKHPHTQEPYIPGSSLKGKIRSLLELYHGLPFYAEKADRQNKGLTTHELLNFKEAPSDIREKARKILKFFGTSGSAQDFVKDLGPTRVGFSDCFYTEEYRKKLYEEGLPHVEVKAENRINRLTGTAEHPRFTERVPAGAEFDFKINLKILNSNEEEELLNELLTGMKLLEYDYLGGSGSRGYGRIKFEIEGDEALKKRFETLNPF